MSLMKEIEKLMNTVESSASFRLVNIGGKSEYIEGIKSVVFLSSDEMRFQLKSKLAIVKGANLMLKYLDKTTCVINGEIKVVELQWNLK